MRALLAKSATGNLRSKILDPKYNRAELILEVTITPSEFAIIVEKYDEEEFELVIKNR